jgi:hypothetical protein
VFLHDEEGPISPFHDIPLVANENPPSKTYHVVIEVRDRIVVVAAPGVKTEMFASLFCIWVGVRQTL